MGIPYDDERGYAICGAVTSIMCGESYATSAEMASVLGPFPNYSENADHMLRVIKNHRLAAYDAPAEEYGWFISITYGNKLKEVSKGSS